MTPTALITGATGALGQHLTRALASSGYQVIINYRHNQRIAARLAQATTGRAIQADVTDRAAVKKLFAQAGPIDILINTVGDFIYQPLSKTAPRELAECVENNLFSAWYCLQAALPGMKKRKFGRVISFGSAGCDQLTARPFTTPYYIAKTGLLMVTRSLARDYAGSGVTINMIAPGVLPHGVRPAGAPVVSYQEIINGVLFLLSPAASRLSGAYLEISRGWRPT